MTKIWKVYRSNVSLTETISTWFDSLEAAEAFLKPYIDSHSMTCIIDQFRSDTNGCFVFYGRDYFWRNPEYFPEDYEMH